jgi:hypothetical protein
MGGSLWAMDEIDLGAKSNRCGAIRSVMSLNNTYLVICQVLLPSAKAAACPDTLRTLENQVRRLLLILLNFHLLG